jgi:hypothetical protein
MTLILAPRMVGRFWCEIEPPVTFREEGTEWGHKALSPSDGNASSPPQTTQATGACLQLAPAFAVESVLSGAVVNACKRIAAATEDGLLSDRRH